jgi:PAS domain S-box-containing protein
MKMISTDTSYLFETAFDLSPAPTILTDANFCILKVNRSFLQTFAGSAAGFKGKMLFKCIGLQEDEAEQLKVHLNLNQDIPQNCQYEAFLSGGAYGRMWAIIDNRKIDFHGERLNISVINNISILKKEEEGSRGNEPDQQKDVTDTEVLVHFSKQDGCIEYANKKWLTTLGYTQSELEHLNIADVIQDDQVPQYFTELNRVHKGQKGNIFETIFKSKYGKPVYVEGAFHAKMENGRCTVTRAVFRDVSKRKVMEETYSTIIQNFPVSMYIIHDGLLRFVNPSLQALTGYTAAELVGKSAFTLIHPEDVSIVQKTASRLASTGRSASYECRIITKSGEVRWVMETIIYIPYEGSRAILGTLVDISTQKFVEESLKESKNRYQTLFNSASDAIIINSLDGKILEVNVAACNVLKYTRSELLKMNMSDLRPPSSQIRINNFMEDLLNNGSYNQELGHLSKDGIIIPMEVHGILIEYEQQKAILNVVRDISARHKAESVAKRYALRLESQVKINEFKSEHAQDLLYFTLIEALKLTESEIGYLYHFNADKSEFSVNTWSKDLMKLTGRQLNPSRFKAAAEGTLTETINQQMPLLKNQLQIPDLSQNGFPRGNYELKRHMLIPVYSAQKMVALIAVANKSTDYDLEDVNQLSLFVGAVWNVLQRWKFEEAIKTSEQRYRQLVDCSQDGIVSLNEKGQVEMANPAACKMFGYSRDEFIGMQFSYTLPAEERITTDQRLADIQAHNIVHFERNALRSDNKIFPIDVSISPLTQGRVQQVIRDITQRKIMENELQESIQKYRLLVENQTDLVFELNQFQEFLFVNPSYCKLIGKDKYELIGKNMNTLVHPEDLTRVIKEVLEVFFPPFTSYSEHRVRTENGWRWIALNSNAVLDTLGDVTAITCMGRDITESKLAKEELEKANQQLRELDKLKDNFLSTVSHELRTPLTSIKSFAEILLNYNEDPATQKEFLGIINEESDRLTRLINDFLDISKIQAGKIVWKNENVDLKAVINNAVLVTRPLFEKSKLNLVTDVAPELPRVFCDRDRVTQVFTNLFGNAVKFTPEGGQVALKVWAAPDNDPSVRRMVTVSIQDTGIGIAPENHTRIFENFGQVGDVLKDRPKGTGLGLPISKKIIEGFGGKMWIESALGKGTTFLFTLPVANSENLKENK